MTNSLPSEVLCYLVTKSGKSDVSAAFERRPFRELPAGDVVIRVAYSSLNFKDALAAKGHPGVVSQFPHVPGIDAAGTVVQSSAASAPVGSQVLVTSYGMGAACWGGWAEYIRVPTAWVIPLPDGLSLEDSMRLGTAGLTAGLSVQVLREHSVLPDAGPVIVTGATGGVGSLAVQILAKLGYEVAAVTGKSDQADWLCKLGASDILAREDLDLESKRPLSKGVWAGAIDCVGGAVLSAVLRSMTYTGCVTACGLVGGADLNMTVYPFILRGVVLAGIDSAECPRERRLTVWNRLADEWRPAHLADDSQTISFDRLPEAIETIYQGRMVGRTVVRIAADA